MYITLNIHIRCYSQYINDGLVQEPIHLYNGNESRMRGRFIIILPCLWLTDMWALYLMKQQYVHWLLPVFGHTNTQKPIVIKQNVQNTFTRIWNVWIHFDEDGGPSFWRFYSDSHFRCASGKRPRTEIGMGRSDEQASWSSKKGKCVYADNGHECCQFNATVVFRWTEYENMLCSGPCFFHLKIHNKKKKYLYPTFGHKKQLI